MMNAWYFNLFVYSVISSVLKIANLEAYCDEGSDLQHTGQNDLMWGEGVKYH